VQIRFSFDGAKTILAAAAILMGAGVTAARADDQGLLGRLFRFGSPAPATPSSTSTSSSSSSSSGSSLPYGYSTSNSSIYSTRPASGAASMSAPGASPSTRPMGTTNAPVSTPPTAPGSQRVAPQPRYSSSVTNADPVLTRFAVGRSNDGSQFGMCLQVFADGTVIDSEGVHRLRPADIRPIMETIQSGELYRVKGHCGAPPTDFVEYVHIVAYEHRYGRLMAHSFSYSGNPQGCDQTLRQLHTMLENLQAKLSGQPAPGATAVPVAAGSPAAGANALSPGAPAALPASPTGRGESTKIGDVIPLTPIDAPR
jgi:hypothetical protein